MNVIQSDLRQYILKSAHTSRNRPKGTRVIRDVLSMVRSDGAMYFKTVNDGTLRRLDADWNLVGISVQKPHQHMSRDGFWR